ncbi:hypothetical protein [Egbenema bharatensis]|uniref:hypothetical protein n=1 Tax=Egbenema bharatensis TaxID=3463334 RepID=UPI003A8732FD
MSRYNRPITSAEQTLYDHLLYWIELESPSAMIERFRTLFIDGAGYPDPEVSQALKTIVAADPAIDDFRYILNRCCHILINRWQSRPQSHGAIPELVHVFESPFTTRHSLATQLRSTRRLRQLVQEFTTTEQFLTLRRLAQVLTEAEAVNIGNRPLGTLIRRYPYLYEYCLLNEDSAQEQQSTVRQVQATLQHQFEIHLSQYVTYQIRQAQMARKAVPDRQTFIRPVSNPTLLSDRELGQAIKHYIGRVDGSRTHKDLAQSFLTHTHQRTSFAAFKDDLYEYITAPIDPAYGKRQFNHQLYRHLNAILPDQGSQRVNDFLIVRTCSQLLNFLVADQPHHPNHFVFIDLTTNLGAIATTGVLLRIVLFCRKVKPYLERRFSILFNHYEAHTKDTVLWLIQALENLNLALTTNFGSINLSFLR